MEQAGNEPFRERVYVTASGALVHLTTTAVDRAYNSIWLCNNSRQ